ncbi:hypothetical protein ACPC58_00315 [Streptococcus sp. VTCC 12905]|uniref:hypothetical protein n=1 Tax=Streptococcus sp. VTCC 12905 TaxID=3413768 RepID=UPI003D9C7509
MREYKQLVGELTKAEQDLLAEYGAPEYINDNGKLKLKEGEILLSHSNLCYNSPINSKARRIPCTNLS